MQPRITFDPSLRQNYGDGKYFIYRKVDTGEYLPYDETYSDIYVDTNPVLGATNNYVYKFVTGARDTPLYGPLTYYVPLPPTPLPTCAFYLYDYSHELTHENTYVSRIASGKYTYKQNQSGTILLEHENAKASILYVPKYSKWYIISAVTALTVNSTNGTRITYYGSARNRDSKYDKVYRFVDKISNTTINISKYYYTIKTKRGTYSRRFYWNKQLTGGFYYVRQYRWWSRSWSYQYYHVTLYDDLVDVPDESFEALHNLSVTLYTSTTVSEGPPSDWVQGGWFNVNFGSPPSITCFRPTPTPTGIPLEPPPTPTPTAYPITPSPTAIPLPTRYFITEWDSPILTETGDYIVME